MSFGRQGETRSLTSRMNSFTVTLKSEAEKPWLRRTVWYCESEASSWPPTFGGPRTVTRSVYYTGLSTALPDDRDSVFDGRPEASGNGCTKRRRAMEEINARIASTSPPSVRKAQCSRKPTDVRSLRCEVHTLTQRAETIATRGPVVDNRLTQLRHMYILAPIRLARATGGAENTGNRKDGQDAAKQYHDAIRKREKHWNEFLAEQREYLESR